MMQILRPREDEPWAFGVHQCSRIRDWTEDEIALFGEIGRYATLALNNTLLHDRATRDIAKVNAILDQIPEAAAIYDAQGRLERMNVAATHERAQLLGVGAEERLQSRRQRTVDGKALTKNDLPSIRALRGETVKADYLVYDPRSKEDRVINYKSAPIYDAHGAAVASIGAIMPLSRLTAQNATQLAALITQAAAQISSRMGHAPSPEAPKLKRAS